MLCKHKYNRYFNKYIIKMNFTHLLPYQMTVKTCKIKYVAHICLLASSGLALKLPFVLLYSLTDIFSHN